MIQATFAIPGDIGAPTGGYAYARRLLAEAGGAGVEFTHLALPGGYPCPSAAELSQTEAALSALPTDRAILIDGLALGALPAAMLAGLPGPVIGLCHHPLALETGIAPDLATRLRASEHAALAACARVIATSETTANTLVAEYDVPRGRLSVACPGTDPAYRASGSASDGDGSGIALLSVGSLTPRKGHDVLIAALAGLAHLDWHLTIAGPADHDAVHARELEDLIAEAGLGGRVMLAGALDGAGIARAYGRADLFVLASRYEGFGMAYREAMAHGLAVVGCAAGAVPEATAGAVLLVEPGDVSALRAGLAPLIGDAVARARLADRCWRAAQSFARWPETAAIVAAVLREAAL